MPEFNLYMSNSLEALADRLAGTVAERRVDVMRPEVVVVQSRGMQRWVSLALAARLGVWANFRYLLPNEIVHELFAAVIPGLPEERLFRTDLMTWRVMALLPSFATDPAFAALTSYLSDDTDGRKRYQLSSKIVDVFDQYLTYRPEMILDWESGSDGGWQAALWRTLREGMRFSNPPRLQRDFFSRIGASVGQNGERLPARVAVFGVSALPVFHVEVLAAAAERLPVNIYHLNPSPLYWGDIAPGRTIARHLGVDARKSASGEHLEKGNSLLASLGRQGRDYLKILIDRSPREFFDERDPGEESLLRTVQRDIFSVTDRGAGEAPPVSRSFDEIGADGSISIASCHSPMREIEVLRDFVIDCLGRDPSLAPRDIIVMTPDVETYAPFVHAVFDPPAGDAGRIPFTIVDRGPRAESAVLDVFFSTLDLTQRRFRASEVLAILACEDVRRRFGLDQAAVELISGWIGDTRIAWGIDAAHRESMGLPPEDRNTWSAGLDRLLLGYAMRGSDDRIFKGILPADAIGSGDGEVLGRFLDFFETLRRFRDECARPKPLSDWQATITGIIDALFDPSEESERYLLRLRECAAGLPELHSESGYADPVPVTLIRDYLDDGISRAGGGGEFITGRLTFCAMMPMRSVPFRVICMIGMNDASFPRRETRVGFDLIAGARRAGDRSLRDEDRYLFLESLISAQDRLYISYCGQGVQDNREIPPSIVVSELLDYLVQAIRISDGGTDDARVREQRVRERLVIRHPLQSFNPAYFNTSGPLFSYSAADCEGARALRSRRDSPRPFLDGALAPLSPEEFTITLEDLADFFDNPARFLLVRRLGIRYDETAAIVSDDEPFTLRGLERWEVNQRLLRALLDGDDADVLAAILHAGGVLPHGGMGKARYDDLVPGARSFARIVFAQLAAPPLPALPVDLSVAEFSVAGAIDGIREDGRYSYRYAACKARDRLRAWIAHCALNAAAPPEAPLASRFISMTAKMEAPLIVSMSPFDAPASHFASLLRIYQEGLRAPLPFFPESSYEYARLRFAEGRTSADAMTRARRVWEGDDFSRGERLDPYLDRVFGGGDPFGSRFVDLAERVFRPMLEGQEEVDA